MTSTGKRVRKVSGMNRYEIKRSSRRKRHEALNSGITYNPGIGTNARLAIKRKSDKR